MLPVDYEIGSAREMLARMFNNPADQVGRCRLTVSNPVLKAFMVSAFETTTQ